MKNLNFTSSKTINEGSSIGVKICKNHKILKKDIDHLFESL